MNRDRLLHWLAAFYDLGLTHGKLEGDEVQERREVAEYERQALFDLLLNPDRWRADL